MARKKPQGGGGAPEWLVTFADLMSLLLCFFVLLLSFSTQNQQKLQIVSGSVKDAFGVKETERRTGIIEVEGVPVRDYLKNVSQVEQEMDSDFASEAHEEKSKQGPEANTHDTVQADIERSRQFATAAASLRQALQEMPDITEISQNIIFEETEEGLNIMIVDQDGRAMFQEGSRFPYETTRRLLTRIAPVLAEMPNRIQVTGHTTTGSAAVDPNYSKWELSADRANATRKILTEYGVPNDQIFSVVGKADTEPLFPNDPFLAANRRINILLMAEEPPLPLGHNP
ncbi:OmpA/MotB family protein [Pannonibacter tanglangensis]|uniref:OmpA family protein n=1 Tax=Pannonibacter tanglangensis TaxID=2750084 RepID=A0ABW9ZK82_9HYPH|nr:flagellar motor protein MotB [Pannonibacter sp. XCT-34]NBN65318.1 OmpA family protein [Pannonibacter sp. XCT-34]